MNTRKCLTSACRYCRFYQPEGMQGGSCQQLSVPVRSEWKACPLAMPAFSPTWEEWEDLLPNPENSPAIALSPTEELEIEYPPRILTSLEELTILTSWSSESDREDLTPF